MAAKHHCTNHHPQSTGQSPSRWRLWGAALLWLAPLLLLGQVSVTARLSQEGILIGDQLTLNIQVYYQGGVVVESVGYDRLKEVPELELLQLERFEKDNGAQGKLLEYQARLTAFDSGYYRLPPMPVVYRQGARRDTAYTPELGLLVKTLPISEEDQKLMPIKDIIAEPLAFMDLLPWLIGLAVLLIVVLMLLSLRRKKAPPPPPPPVLKPAHELALGELERLEQQKLWQKGFIKEYYVRLTHALESADLVKFAKAQPPASFHAEALEQARAFVEQTQDETCLVDARQYATAEVPEPLPHRSTQNRKL